MEDLDFFDHTNPPPHSPVDEMMWEAQCELEATWMLVQESVESRETDRALKYLQQIPEIEAAMDDIECREYARRGGIKNESF